MLGAGCWVQSAGRRVQGEGCWLQSAGCRLQVVDCRLVGTGCRLVGTERLAQGAVQGAGRRLVV